MLCLAFSLTASSPDLKPSWSVESNERLRYLEAIKTHGSKQVIEAFGKNISQIEYCACLPRQVETMVRSALATTMRIIHQD